MFQFMEVMKLREGAQSSMWSSESLWFIMNTFWYFIGTVDHSRFITDGDIYEKCNVQKTNDIKNKNFASIL